MLNSMIQAEGFYLITLQKIVSNPDFVVGIAKYTILVPGTDARIEDAMLIKEYKGPVFMLKTYQYMHFGDWDEVAYYTSKNELNYYLDEFIKKREKRKRERVTFKENGYDNHDDKPYESIQIR